MTATLGMLTRRAAAVLAAAGVTEPRREALRLLADLMDRSPGAIVLHAGDPVPAELAERALAATGRRAAGEPIAYVSGWAGFRNLTLQVDRRVLIPRPETEGLVELVLKSVSGGRVVDVGTGSGCIALSLAQEGRFDQVTATDRSAAALAVARGNARRLGMPVTFVEADLVSAFAGGSCQAVVSNPPYLTDGELEQLDPSVRDWEPAEALASGHDGLDALRRLIVGASRVLVEGGLLAVEVDSSRAEQVAALARHSDWGEIAITKDLFGRNRFVTARRGPCHDR
ncbi:MAG: peptide chain release factor N(5)-glutamine methyltransferase [Gemmatimonadota bacterium]|nr:peptide chain release factor N(5)-glutamine methyltransferase [Gemmatimonadota bacterium]